MEDLPKSLLKLKTRNGDRLIDNELLFQVMTILSSGVSEEDVLAMFTERGTGEGGKTEFDDWREAYFSLPYFNEARKLQALSNEVDLGKTVPIEGEACPHCGSTNVATEGSYNRALDEAGQAKAFCRNCGNRFRLD